MNAARSAILVDHILEAILDAGLKTKDLLNCRNVCHRWNYVVVPKLIHRISVTFEDLKLGKKSKDLTQLTALLERTSKFPCSKFRFSFMNEKLIRELLSNNSLSGFLTIHGVHLHRLTLFFGNHQVPKLAESQVMKDIQNLLLVQAPNLLYLSLDIDYSIATIDQSDITNSGILLPSILNPTSSIANNERKNPNLKVVRLGRTASENLLEMIFLLAPNLQSVELQVMYYKHLINPNNRLHFIKQLVYCPTTILENEFYNKIANNSSIENLKLQNLYVDLMSVAFDVQFGDLYDPAAEARAANALNRIFESSWDSLEDIFLNHIYVEGIKFPCFMPKVKGIGIRSRNGSIYEEKSMFLPGFTWSKTFPALCDLSIGCKGSSEDFVRFFKSLNFEQIKSVKNVRISLSGPILKRKFEHFELVLPFFPNATVQGY